MTFSLHQGEVVMSSQITPTIIQYTPRSHAYIRHLHHDFQELHACYNLSQPHRVTAFHTSAGNNPSEHRRVVQRTQGQAEMAQLNYHLHMHQGSPLLFFHVASTITPLLPKTIIMPSIQSKLCLPCTHPPITSAINTLLAILYSQYSSILSTCPNNLNTLCAQYSYKSNIKDL